MEPAALPAARISRRPDEGGAGRCGGRQLAGCAAPTAARNRSSSRAREGAVTLFSRRRCGAGPRQAMVLRSRFASALPLARSTVPCKGRTWCCFGPRSVALAAHAGKWPVPSLSYCGQVRKSSGPWQREKEHAPMPLDEKTTTELEAAAFRRLLEHLRARTDVQNLDLMNLAGFCRNCLSNWMKEAADARGVAMSKDESRETIYGMPYEEWKAKHQKEAAKDQQAAFEKTGHRHEILSPVYSG